MIPSATVSVSAATPSVSRPRSSRIPRTSAQASRSAVPLFSIDWLPAVMPSLGVRPYPPRHAHALERQVELFGRDLRKRGDDALAELDLAGEHRARAVRVDADPGVEHAVVRQAAGQIGAPLREREFRIEREGNDDARGRR